ncbi:hypothetical protein CP960_06925 [Malaciobacter halophilus]|uniref:Uncharacterized protein n=1 Tax=Malaciobacter halophilus TaxID=197482 RepID=A0A2N1J371_9BACT|nr:hypothetical protein [Malaciobacter halophilus]AXH10592.1 hypothetical protein AHALO_2262 [Malaciobacter halophilus]PKI80964.1 hypothetical protein CP960_06925 [Malaciobacter halophilus]
MKNFDKYVNENIKDFSEVRKLLEEDNIKKISYKDNWNTNNHTKLLLDFFKIDMKNEVLNLEDIFFHRTEKYSFYTTFSLSEILKKQELEESSFEENEQIEILLPYIKEPKYFREMIKPLNKIIDVKYSPYIHLNNDRNKMCLTIYDYTNNENKNLKIIKADHISKNPLYGLLHYINLDSYLFSGKALALQRLKKVSLDQKNFNMYQKFFDNIKINGYKFKLEVKESSNINLEKKFLSLFFYHENKNTTDSILSFENFDIEFIITFFERFYYLDTALEQINQNNMRLRFYFDEQDVIKLQIHNDQIEIEKDATLLSNLLRDVFQEQDLGIINVFKFILSNQYDISKRISKESYYNFDVRKQIIYKIRGLMK